MPFKFKKIDLHIHSTVSDGTDTPLELISNIKNKGIGIFALTDHDALKGCEIIRGNLKDEEISFINGVEFSCKDGRGNYHILGYGYDTNGKSVRELVDLGHSYRMAKIHGRIEHLRSDFGFEFPEDELKALFSMDNPGKPHIGNMMVRCGYAESKNEAIEQYLNKIHFKASYISPGEAIDAIKKSGGIPVLAHPFYGSGDQLILGKDMEERLKYLLDLGLMGVEAFYSGFSVKLRNEMLSLAEKYDMYVTAGSDYHGKNKMIELGDTGLTDDLEVPNGLVKFLNKVGAAI